MTSTGNGIINIGIKGDTDDSGELNVSKDNPNITNDTYGLNITNGKVISKKYFLKHYYTKIDDK